MLLFMLMFFIEIRVMLSFSPLAVEPLGKEGNMGFREKELQGIAGQGIVGGRVLKLRPLF